MPATPYDATVNTDDVDLELADGTTLTLKRGQTVNVRKINPPYSVVRATVDGRKRSGSMESQYHTP